MDVFQMYVANGYQADFWVRKLGWNYVVAKVLRIAGKTSGPFYVTVSDVGVTTRVDVEFWGYDSHIKQWQLLAPQPAGPWPRGEFRRARRTWLLEPESDQYVMIVEPNFSEKWHPKVWHLHPIELAARGKFAN